MPCGKIFCTNSDSFFTVSVFMPVAGCGQAKLRDTTWLHENEINTSFGVEPVVEVKLRPISA